MEKEKMYAPDRKESFLRDWENRTSGRSDALLAGYRYMFVNSAPYEIKYGRDLCEMDPLELKDYLEGTASIRSVSKTRHLGMLKNYIEWCSKTQDVCVSDAISHATITGIDKMRRSMVSGPVHLQRVLDAYFDPVELHTIDVVYRCYLWLAFAGMEEEDIMCVRCRDVDLNSMTVWFNGEPYRVEREAAAAFRDAAVSPFFIYYHPNYEPVYKNRAYGDELIRGFSAPRLLTVRSRISTLSKAAEYKFEDGKQVKISYYRVWLSGQFYRLYEAERAGVQPDFTQLAKHYIAGKYEDDPATAHKIFVKEKRNYRLEYERWKLAFQT